MSDRYGRPGGKKRKGAVPPSTIDLTATEVSPPAAEVRPGVTEDPTPPDVAVGAAPLAEAGEALTPEGDPVRVGEDPAQAPPEPELQLAAAEPEPEPQPASATREPEPVSSSAAAQDDPPHFGQGPRPAGAPQAPRLDVFDEPAADRHAFMPSVAAALLGAIAGAVIVLAFAMTGKLPGLRDGDDTVSPRLAALEQDVQSGRRVLDETVGRVAVVETAARTAGEAATGALNLAEEAKATAAPAAVASGDTVKLQADVAALRSSLAAADERAAKAQADLATALDRVSGLEKGLAAIRPDGSAYAVALSQLEDAMRRGGPFEAELKTAVALSGGSAALAPVAPLAAAGAPSPADLARDFEAVRPAIVAALSPSAAAPGAEAPLADRVLSALGTVVAVLKVGDPEPGDPAEPVKRVSDALALGDLPGALAAFAELPEPARAAGAGWFAKADGAAKARAAVHAETTAALQSLSRK